MLNENEQVLESLPPNSLHSMFWKQQLNEMAPLDDQMVYTTIIGVYEMLRESGCLRLPSQQTLRDYTYHVKATTGYSDDDDDDADSMLVEVAKIDELEDYQKCVILLIAYKIWICV